MINLLDSKIALIVVSITAFIIAVGIGLAIENTSDEKTTERYSSIDSGGPQTARRDGFYSYINRNESFEEQLPLTVETAIINGWIENSNCDLQNGRFFNKTKTPYLLGYDAKNELLSIYLFSKEKMPEPWIRSNTINTNLYPSINYDHFKLIIHFKDPINACSINNN
tara:strand:+ start:1102 stop:1602 length:501 start_codon:yes stop_codon:yes gene_type:complete